MLTFFIKISNLDISSCCFSDYAKEMGKKVKCTCISGNAKLSFCPLHLQICDVLVQVPVVVSDKLPIIIEFQQMEKYAQTFSSLSISFNQGKNIIFLTAMNYFWPLRLN